MLLRAIFFVDSSGILVIVTTMVSLLVTLYQVGFKGNPHTLLLKSPRAKPPLVPSCPAEAKRIGTAQQLAATRRRGLRESGPLMFGKYL